MADEQLTDEEIIEKQQQEEELELQRWRNDLAWLMSHEKGLRIIERIFDKTHVNGGDLFDKHAGVMARRIGEQEIGKWLQMELVQANPELYMSQILMKWAARLEAQRKSNRDIQS